GDLALELALMVEYGLDPLQALLTATRNAAEVMDLQEEIGTLEKGKSADVVVVEGNPLDQISALREVTVVMKGGQTLPI
ncbi:MAG: amidohydrolase family protein, partial [Thermomicrobiales bacterium]|nr:amidohydrolase family protein [Thermomicrobiales bacterium]